VGKAERVTLRASDERARVGTPGMGDPEVGGGAGGGTGDVCEWVRSGRD